MAGFGQTYTEALCELFRAYIAASACNQEARRNLSAEEIARFRSHPAEFFLSDGDRMVVKLTGDNEFQIRYIDRVRKIRFEYLFLASVLLEQGIRSYEKATRNQPAEFFRANNRLTETFRFVSDSFTLLIGGTGNDVYGEDADWIIDLDGDDRYHNNAGGCLGSKRGVAICIDHSGDDRYDSKGKMFVQGAGCLGTGFLVDFEGNDRYSAGHFSQGAGLLGVGIIWDREGNDAYSAGIFCQAAGNFGVGMIVDSAGDDAYSAASIAQGAGTCMGLGLLSDKTGNDTYRSWLDRSDKRNLGFRTIGLTQGAGLGFRNWPIAKRLSAYGGIGILSDADGNDHYNAPGGFCVQGGSYIMSLGVLLDHNGDDVYASHMGMGSSVHVAAAILIDSEGDDKYTGGFRTGGSGADRSPGIFIDYEGNDEYRAGRASFGTSCKHSGYSLFVDYRGEDLYITDRPAGPIRMNDWGSFGAVWPAPGPTSWPYAIFLDLGGDDSYQVKRRQNNAERNSFGHGIQLDTEWIGGDVIGQIADPLPPYSPLQLPDAARKSPYSEPLSLLAHPDVFIRFQAIGRISKSPDDVIPIVVEILKSAPHPQIVRDLSECISYFLTEQRIREGTSHGFDSLLQAVNPEVRRVTANSMAMWGIPDETGLIAAAENDPDQHVREQAMAALRVLEIDQSTLLAKKLVLSDRSAGVRRQAALILARSKNDTELLIGVMEKDSSPVVRVAAAAALVDHRNPRCVEPFRTAAKKPDIHLRRQAGRGLAELNLIEGVEILIESLRFGSIDSFQNYGTNIPNDIADYLGTDFEDHNRSESDRYDPDAWIRWLQNHKNVIDLHANIAARDAYHELRNAIEGASTVERLPFYREFHENHPTHTTGTEEFARLLNEVALSMVSDPTNNETYNPGQGLTLAQEAVQLDPDPNYVDTLALAYVQVGRPPRKGKKYASIVWLMRTSKANRS